MLMALGALISRNGLKISPYSAVHSFIKEDIDLTEPMAHPFINIIYGADNTHYNVHIRDFKYRMSSLLQAFDILFKSTFVLGINYPSKAKHIFTVVQKYFYNIEGSEKEYNCSDTISLLHSLHHE